MELNHGPPTAPESPGTIPSKIPTNVSEDQLGGQMHQHQHFRGNQHDQHHHHNNAAPTSMDWPCHPTHVSLNTSCTLNWRKVGEPPAGQRNASRTTSRTVWRNSTSHRATGSTLHWTGAPVGNPCMKELYFIKRRQSDSTVRRERMGLDHYQLPPVSTAHVAPRCVDRVSASTDICRSTSARPYGMEWTVMLVSSDRRWWWPYIIMPNSQLVSSAFVDLQVEPGSFEKANAWQRFSHLKSVMV